MGSLRRWLYLLLVFLLALTCLPGRRADDGDIPEVLDPSPGDEGISTGHRTETDTSQTAAQPHAFRGGAERFQFQAEVNRLMDIIINSLYSNRDIFLRELISNASDALDKIRLLGLRDKTQLGEGEETDLKITIKLDKDRRILSIRDTGVGMTREDLKNNLGTIAKSGTSAFLEQMQKGGDVNLIGQFGVGFYSVYLVADYVEVVSKHNDDKQYIWESQASGDYAISVDTDGEPLGRGTQINIHLKEEAQEYADETKLRELVGKYSEFINFPIYLWGSKEVDKETDQEADDAAADTDSNSEEDDVEDVDEDSEEEEAETPKIEKETVWDWELLNDNKAIWLRSPSDVSEDEYNKFFKAVSKSSADPLAFSHFKAEGDVEFKSVLFIPPTAPMDFLNNFYETKPQLRLYVRRVFISDDFEELMPKMRLHAYMLIRAGTEPTRKQAVNLLMDVKLNQIMPMGSVPARINMYLAFLHGIVDSDTLPLSVSRETLQQSAALKTIRKKLVRKVLDVVKKLSDADRAVRNPEEGKAPDEEANKAAAKYQTFWAQFGKAMKLGVIEDSQNRNRLAKLLRVQTSKSGGKLISLEEYVERMKPGQKNIYYLAGETVRELEKSPFLEQLLAKDYEVIYFTDPVDEYLMQNLLEFEDIKFQNASKDDLKLGDKDAKKENKKLKEMFKELTNWWKGAVSDPNIESVKISTRLSTTPCVVVTSKYGWSANMERIMRSQALGDAERASYMKGKRILEINPHHPLITELKQRFEADKDSSTTASLASLLYETALLESGFQIDNPKAFNSRIYSLVKDALDLKGDLSVPAEPDEPQDEADEEPEALDAEAEQDDTDGEPISEGRDEL